MSREGRREALKKIGLLLLSTGSLFSAGQLISCATTPSKKVVSVPPISKLKVDRVIRLVAQGTKAWLGENLVNLWSFTRGKLSEQIVLIEGETVEVQVENRLKENISVHWHGLLLNEAQAGAERLVSNPIRYGEVGSYIIQANMTGTFWYHTQLNNAMQLGRGLVGALIVKPKIAYPVDRDEVIFIKDWKVNEQGEVKNNFYIYQNLVHDGTVGNLVLVNGKVSPVIEVNLGARVRLRLINGCNARIASVFFPSSFKVTVVARDGQPLVRPKKYIPIPLGPGMRLDVVVDVPLKAELYPVIDTQYNKFKLFSILAQSNKQLSKRTTLKIFPLPNNFRGWQVGKSTHPIITREEEARFSKISRKNQVLIKLEGGAMSSFLLAKPSLDKRERRVVVSDNLPLVWAINGVSMADNQLAEQPLFVLKKGEVYKVKIINKSFYAQPLHFHGHLLKVVVANGGKLKDPFWVDTVLLRQGEALECLIKASNVGKWLLHSQIAAYQSAGLKGWFQVI